SIYKAVYGVTFGPDDRRLCTLCANTNHAGHTATLLPGGKVLVSGGIVSGATYLSSAELYDPVSGTWAPTCSMSMGRYRHRATLLPNGKVLVVGAAGIPSTAELNAPPTGRCLKPP